MILPSTTHLSLNTIISCQQLEAIRTRIEQFDLKNSDLIQRSGYGSIPFTKRRWVSLTEEIQDLTIRGAILNRSRMYFAGLQRHFIMIALVDCALAKLILIGKIMAKDIFVYQRAIEDAIDLLLMRSRAESQLASMATAIDVLDDLKATWAGSEQQNLINCSINDAQDSDGSQRGILAIKDLAYTRGSAAVRRNACFNRLLRAILRVCYCVRCVSYDVLTRSDDLLSYCITGANE